MQSIGQYNTEDLTLKSCVYKAVGLILLRKFTFIVAVTNTNHVS